MHPDQIAYLDELSAFIRKFTGAAVSRSAILRGMVRGAQRTNLILDGCESEDRIVRYVALLLTLGLDIFKARSKPPAAANPSR